MTSPDFEPPTLRPGTPLSPEHLALAAVTATQLRSDATLYDCASSLLAEHHCTPIQTIKILRIAHREGTGEDLGLGTAKEVVDAAMEPSERIANQELREAIWSAFSHELNER
jgi:hypothetical protein